MQNINLSNLISFKLDFSLIQDPLSLTINNLITRITALQQSITKISQSHTISKYQYNKPYQMIQQQKQNTYHPNKMIPNYIKQSTITNLQNNLKYNKQNYQFISFVDQTPSQVLDHIQNRLSQNNINKNIKKFDVNAINTSNNNNISKIYQIFRVKSLDNNLNTTNIDQKIYTLYSNIVDKMEMEIISLRKQLKNKTNNLDNNLIVQNYQNNIQQQQIKYQNYQNTINQIQHIMQTNIQEPQLSEEKSIKNLITTQHKQQLQSYIIELKNQIQSELQQMIKSATEKFQQLSITNFAVTDQLAKANKYMQDIISDKNSLRLQIIGLKQRTVQQRKQLIQVISTVTQHKNKLKTIDSTFTKLIDQINQCRQNLQYLKDQPLDDDANGNNTSRQDCSRNSHKILTSSQNNTNLLPIRNNSTFKTNNNKIDALQQNIKFVKNKLTIITQRINKLENERKKTGNNQSNGTLPKIQKQGKSNINYLQLLKQQLKKLQNEMYLTSQQLLHTKTKLSQYNFQLLQIPKKIQDIQHKLQQTKQQNQTRLIQLIKQLINRILSQPFDNNFTNRLKKLINVKFLQIKHQYHSILKQIQNHVNNHVQKHQLSKIQHLFQENIIQLKTVINKKCDSDDLKKGIKYLENKLKDVFIFAKTQTTALANQQKQYIGVKKQPLH